MLPTQCLNAYLGSTIRSMEEVVASTSNSVVAYCLLAAQVRDCLIITFLTYGTDNDAIIIKRELS